MKNIFKMVFTGHPQKVPAHLYVKTIENGFMVNDRYCATKEEVVGVVSDVLVRELNGEDR